MTEIHDSGNWTKGLMQKVKTREERLSVPASFCRMGPQRVAGCRWRCAVPRLADWQEQTAVQCVVRPDPTGAAIARGRGHPAENLYGNAPRLLKLDGASKSV